ncbi:MAG TPA: hypothetical protein VLZ74_05920 [Methylocella sp.]|nr:hypothetical protein [Methylocella sp.]
MNRKRISIISGAALLALTATASAGPLSIASPDVITPPQTQIQPVVYRYHHPYRHYVWYHHRYHHYVWRHGWHYGWYRSRYHRYGWYYPGYYGYYPGYYGANLGADIVGSAVDVATLPFSLLGGWGGYYGSPYYGYYGSPYYSYAGYYGYPHYRHYAYWHRRHYAAYGGGIHTGRSVGYRHMHR